MPKKLSILGDSISTFYGHIPSGQTAYYGTQADVAASRCTAALDSVNDCWWKKVQLALGMQMCVNNSWSGSLVSKGGDSPQADDKVGCGSRCVNLHSGTTMPDVIIVYMGINDYHQRVLLGSYDGTEDMEESDPADWTLPTTFREAYSVMLGKILNAYPHAEVWACTLPPFRDSDGTFPKDRSGSDSLALEEYNRAIRELALAFGARLMDFSVCGQTWFNTQVETHPDKYGHSLLANYAIRQMDPSVHVAYATTE